MTFLWHQWFLYDARAWFPSDVLFSDWFKINNCLLIYASFLSWKHHVFAKEGKQTISSLCDRQNVPKMVSFEWKHKRSVSLEIRMLIDKVDLEMLNAIVYQNSRFDSFFICLFWSSKYCVHLALPESSFLRKDAHERLDARERMHTLSMLSRN